MKESIESIRADSKPCQCHRQNQPLISTSIGYDLLNGSHGETHISKDPPSSPLKRKSLHAHIDKEGNDLPVDRGADVVDKKVEIKTIREEHV